MDLFERKLYNHLNILPLIPLLYKLYNKLTCELESKALLISKKTIKKKLF